MAENKKFKIDQLGFLIKEIEKNITSPSLTKKQFLVDYNDDNLLREIFKKEELKKLSEKITNNI